MSKSIFRKELSTLKSYVPGKPIEMVMEEYGLTEVVKLASNENPLGPSKRAIEAIIDEASKVNIYPDPTAEALRKKLAQRHGVEKDQIMIGSGGEEILRMIAMTFIDANDEAIMATPTFDLYDITVDHMGGVSKKFPLIDFEHDLEGMIGDINEKTKLFYICNPNNPIGNIIDRATLKNLLGKIPQEVVVVLDEAYFEYASRNPDYPDGLEILKERPNTIVIRTFAKVAGLAGLRVGYAFSSQSIITEMMKTKGVFNVNRIAQAAALASMDDVKHITDTVDLSYESLGYMMNYFDEKGLAYIKPNGNFIFVDLKMDSREAFTELQKKGMIMRPGYIWKYGTYARISSGDMVQTKKFIHALDEVLGSQ
ncbi:MAG: histidinol-phosphate aminotransferase [delta proteobacterium ML8_F1]|nr:MAG: histidinol-phosphate aminotransferase [delta proteobacterium ML8_F1]